jgi:serine/threonine-protein kinase
VDVGTVFLGKYRVDSILGHGGMGVVAECMHLALNERRAIKMLRQDVLSDQDAVQRFVREAQAAVKLKSEYVAKVHDVGVFENGVPYMEMEFLEGFDLGELLKQRGVLPVPWACELMLQTCEALAEAHSLGIVHRDVKPTNLFVTWRPDGSALVKVLDFGISKSPMGTDMHLTQTQSLLGTPAYMSPEQMRSARLVDSRTDIWSLGTVMYEVLEGRKPFEAESFSEMCVKVAVDPPAPMTNTPPPVQQVIMRCLAKSPEQRYASMAELARDLVPFVQDPHQAGVLVERMNRMLRRSNADFSGDTNSSVRIPRVQADAASGAVRNPAAPGQWGIGSDPAGSPWAVRSEPMGAPFKTPNPAYARAEDGSAPFVRTLQTRRRRWPFMLLGFLLAAGVGTAVVLAVSGGGGEDSKPAAHPNETDHVFAPPTQPPAPPPPPIPAAASKDDKGSAAGSTGSAGSATETKVIDTKPAATPTETKRPSNIHKAPSGTAIRSTRPAGTTAKPSGTTKDTKDATPGAGSGSSKCNPFDAMHRC